MAVSPSPAGLWHAAVKAPGLLGGKSRGWQRVRAAPGAEPGGQDQYRTLGADGASRQV